MSKTKTDEKATFTPPMPPMPPAPPAAEVKAGWEKAIDMQQTTFDSAKEQYGQFFNYMEEMLDSFAEAFPEEVPWMPSWAKPPKSIRKEMKEWEQIANDYFVEMADSWSGFVIESQKMACDKIPEEETK